jgi:hypothetical protein
MLDVGARAGDTYKLCPSKIVCKYKRSARIDRNYSSPGFSSSWLTLKSFQSSAFFCSSVHSIQKLFEVHLSKIEEGHFLLKVDLSNTCAGEKLSHVDYHSADTTTSEFFKTFPFYLSVAFGRFSGRLNYQRVDRMLLPSKHQGPRTDKFINPESKRVLNLSGLTMIGIA